MFQPHAFFYQSHPNIVSKHAPVENIPALFVYKENIHYNFSGKYLWYINIMYRNIVNYFTNNILHKIVILIIIK